MEVPEIPNYKLEKSIGIGRHGYVWMAVDEDGHRVAVKVLDSSVNLDQLLKHSSSVDLESTHDGVALQIHQDLEHEPQHIVTELLADSDSLESWSLENGAARLTTDQSAIWEFLHSLLKALAWMHRRPIPHGNLKPSNIFLLPDGAVRLTDHLLTGLNVNGLSSDGIFYMPPGQLRHPENAGIGAAYSWDVYAFGVEAFRLLTGSFPRMNASFEEAVKKGDEHLLEIEADPLQLAKDLENSKSPEWPDSLQKTHQPLVKLITQCLELHPDRRPANANELLARYEAIIAAPPRKSFENGNPQRRARRLWKRATLGWIAASVALAALATWAWRSESGRFDQLLKSKTLSTEELTKQLESEREESQLQRRESYARELLVRQGLDQAQNKERQSSERFAAMADLNQQLFDFAMGNEPGTSTFLSEETRRAALREDIRGMKSQLTDSEPHRWTKRRLNWYLAQLDYLDDKWTEAEEGLEKALSLPDLWPDNAAAKVIPWRQLAVSRINQNNPDGAKRALSRSFAELKAVPKDSEWYADQLGRNEWLAAKIAATTGNREDEIKHTKAALDAFANAPSGHGSLVYFRKQYLKLADLHSMQLEARGDEKALSTLRREALATLKQALATSKDGSLIYRLGETQLALAKTAQREGDNRELNVQLAALAKSISQLRALSGYADQADLLKAESLMIKAESQWDSGKSASARKLLQSARKTTSSITSPALAAHASFLAVRVEWKDLLLTRKTPSADDVMQLAEKLNQLAANSDPILKRQVRAFRASMLSDTSALLSRTDKEQALVIAKQALEQWMQLLEEFPQQSDYQAMADWTRETLNRLRN